MKTTLLLIAGLIASATPTLAASPVALVEDVQGSVAGAELMDYVTPGQVLKLGAGSAIVLSYLKSCQREMINGKGTVTVGLGESKVDGPTLTKDVVNCDAAHAQAGTRETSEVAATIVRGLEVSAPPVAQAIIYGASPIFEAKGRGALIVDRLDQREDRQQVDLTGRQFKGKFFDFAGTNRVLTPGGTYAASFGASRIVFRVDAQAKPGPGPTLGRLIRMN